MANILNQKCSILNKFLAEIRDVDIQGDSMRFRRNLERIGEVMAYEISQQLPYRATRVETPLGVSEVMLPATELVIGSILRAGIPFHQGFLNYFDSAENTFISAFRKYSKDYSFKIDLSYIASSSLMGKTLILVDPMLATGASLVATYKALIEAAGTPDTLHIAAVIASEEGLEHARNYFSKIKGCTIWCATVDPELTTKSYIVPGLGDVGDLCYGEKL